MQHKLKNVGKMSVHVQNSRMTTTRLRKMKQAGEKIAMLTSYDYTLTRLLDEAGIEMILVGDSASNIVCGNRYTLPITVEEMIFLTKGVVRAAEHALVVIDMPFGSYQVSEEQAVSNALKMMKESGADAVKLEGGEEILPAIRHMVQAGVPVMGHLGLTPQSVNQLGGYGLRAKEDAEAEKLLNDAKLLDEAGCFAIVLEKIPVALAKNKISSGVLREYLPRPPQTQRPNSLACLLIPLFSAYITLVVIPLECQSMPKTQPKL